MSTVQKNYEIKTFLEDFPYEVVHETDVSQKEEYYFVVMALDDPQKFVSPYIFEVFEVYNEHFSLKALPENTQRFILENRTKYQFAFVDKILLTDPFFKAKETFIKENANNIISKRLIGEYADPSLQVALTIENYVEQFKDISSQVGVFAKHKAKSALVTGQETIEKQIPIIKEGLQDLGGKISNKFKQRFKK